METQQAAQAIPWGKQGRVGAATQTMPQWYRLNIITTPQPTGRAKKYFPYSLDPLSNIIDGCDRILAFN